MAEELYRAEELAKKMKVHPETVRRLGREGKILRVKVGRSVRFPMPKAEEVRI